jgi:hypothetical protein
LPALGVHVGGVVEGWHRPSTTWPLQHAGAPLAPV